jgi:hypothetical protein
MKNLFTIIIILLTGSTAVALTVPSSECPLPPIPVLTGPNCSVSFNCMRTDLPAVLVNPGTRVEIGGNTISCDNCAGCPQDPPPPMTCLDTLTVSHTEFRNYSISPKISVEASKTIKWELAGAIQWGSQTTFTPGITCGTSSFPPCSKADPAYQAFMQVWTGRKATMSHDYNWQTTVRCFDIFRRVVSTKTYTDAAGSTTSSATGSKASDSSASCRSFRGQGCK